MVFYAPVVIVIFLADCGVVKMKKPRKNCGADTPLNVSLANYIIVIVFCALLYASSVVVSATPTVPF